MSEVAISNQALGWLGANAITSFDEDSNEAELCKVNYAPSRDAVLEDREWTFAVARVSPAKSDEAPAWGYSSAFPLPADTLRVLEVRDNIETADVYNPLQWVREGNQVLCDSAVVYIRYLRRVTDTTKFSPAFTQTLAARLAADLALPITSSRSLQSDMWALYKQKLRDAAATDGLQGRTKRFRSGSLVRARRY